MSVTPDTTILGRNQGQSQEPDMCHSRSVSEIGETTRLPASKPLHVLPDYLHFCNLMTQNKAFIDSGRNASYTCLVHVARVWDITRDRIDGLANATANQDNDERNIQYGEIHAVVRY